jgi:hypothetical protein
MRGYRSSVEGRLIPAFGAMRAADVTALHLARWRATLPVSPRMKNKLLTELHGIFKRAMKMYGLTMNPAAAVEHLRVVKSVRHRGLQPRGGHGPRPGGGRRTGRSDLPDRRVRVCGGAS